LEKQQQALPPDAAGLRNEVTAAIRSLRDELGAQAPPVAAVDSARPVPASKASDDFESGALTNWRTDYSGAGGWFSYTSGKRRRIRLKPIQTFRSTYRTRRRASSPRSPTKTPL